MKTLKKSGKMRRLQRKAHLSNSVGNIENLVDEVSFYCFFSDLELKQEDKTIVFRPNQPKIFDNAYQIHKCLKISIEKNEFTLLQLPCPYDYNFKEHLFLNQDEEPICLEAYSEQGKYFCDFLYQSLHQTLQREIEKVFKETREDVSKLRKSLHENLNKLNSTGLLDFIKDDLILFLKNATERHLIAIRATAILHNDNYQDIKKLLWPKIHKTLPPNKKDKIYELISDYEKQLEFNCLFPRKYALSSIVEELLQNCSYNKAYNLIEGHTNAYPALFYVKSLFGGIESFSWENENFHLKDLDIKNQLSVKHNDFQQVIEDVDTFCHIARKLSKAEKYLQIENFSAAVVAIQKFMEAYLDAVGATQRGIGKKMKHAKNDTTRMSIHIHKTIIDSFSIAFDKKLLPRLEKAYEPINLVRNNLEHADIGVDTSVFSKKLSYLTEEHLSSDYDSNLFQKWSTLFGLPSKNIFDQLNSRVLTLLTNPDFKL